MEKCCKNEHSSPRGTHAQCDATLFGENTWKILYGRTRLILTNGDIPALACHER